MAGKKLPKDVDFAAGFFSQPASQTDETKVVNEKIVAPAEKTTPTEKKSTPAKKNAGGRPIKQGLKNEQFSLTMNPETYEKLRIIALDKCGGNFSRLIDDAIAVYCKENRINLADIEVSAEILETYKARQEKKRNKK